MFKRGRREGNRIRRRGGFDWDRNQIRVLRRKSKNAKRTLKTSERMLEAFRAQSRGGIRLGLSGKEGAQGTSYRFAHDEAIAAAGIKGPFVLYSLRHTCLTRMGDYTPLPVLQTIAGYYSVTMTMRYVHPQAESVEAAFEKRDELYKSRYTRKFKLARKNQKY